MPDLNNLINSAGLLNANLKSPKAPNIHFRDYHNADYQYELLCQSIADFQEELDDEHEVGVQLASFGESLLLQVTDIGYSNPCLIHFYGSCNGQEAELIQHVNQLNFLLVALPKADPEKPARRIGFDINPVSDE